MKLFHFTILILVLVIETSCSKQQYRIVKNNSVKSIALNPINIDTLNEEVLIIDKRYAILYFRKLDVINYILRTNSLNKMPKGRSSFPNLWELLNKENNPRLVDWWTAYTPKERFKMFGTYTYRTNELKYVGELLLFGWDLIKDGKFMVVDKRSRQIVSDGLTLQAVKDTDNNSFILYELPNGKPFWIDEDTWEHWARMGNR